MNYFNFIPFLLFNLSGTYYFLFLVWKRVHLSNQPFICIILTLTLSSYVDLIFSWFSIPLFTTGCFFQPVSFSSICKLTKKTFPLSSLLSNFCIPFMHFFYLKICTHWAFLRAETIRESSLFFPAPSIIWHGVSLF